jgi:glycosyltransferase involved in cell wall biosynthesis
MPTQDIDYKRSKRSKTVPMPLSAVIITHNAGARLERCLESAAFADEMLVVDSGSSDQTRAIALAHGARVMHQEWLGFGPQKQFAVRAAAHDWVLCLDADEEVTEGLRTSIMREVGAPRARACLLARRNRFLGRWLAHGEGYPDWTLRLFDRRHAQWSDDSVHERVLAGEPAVRLAGELLHDSAESLERYLDKQNRYTSLQATKLHEAGSRAGPLVLIASPIARFVKFYLLRLGFLDGMPGLIHISIGCMNSFNKYAKLIALNRSAP